MKWIFWFSFFGVLSALFALPLVCNSYTEDRVKVLTAHEANIRELLPKFIADLDRLEKNWPFPKRSRLRNAESLLSQNISFTGKGFGPIKTPSHEALRELFAKFPRGVRTQEDFEKFSADSLIAQIDTAWMEGLNGFDHWNPSTHPRIKLEIERAKQLNNLGRIGAFANMPLPETNELRYFGIVYFVQAMKRSETHKGLVMFRKLAELSYSMDSLIGSMVAVGFLKYEPKLAEFSHAVDYGTVETETALALMRTSYGWPGLLSATWFKGFPKEIEDRMKPDLGICTAAHESANVFIAFSDYFEPRAPMEIDFTKPIAEARRVRERLETLCEVDDFRFVSQRSVASANPLMNHDLHSIDGSDTSGLWPTPNPARIPYVRRAVAAVISTIATPNYMKFYTEEAH